MSITDELRAWWVHKYPVIDEELHKDFTAIVNRIDAEHEKACDDAWDNGYEADYVGIEKWLTEHPQAMEHHGWVRLPVDADGEVWNVGDFAVGEVNPNNPQEVERMLWYGLDSGWQIETDHIIFPCPEKAHHYHAPTVEDVLREMLYKAHIYDEREMELLPDLIAEYAAQLQLRGDAE